MGAHVGQPRRPGSSGKAAACSGRAPVTAKRSQIFSPTMPSHRAAVRGRACGAPQSGGLHVSRDLHQPILAAHRVGERHSQPRTRQHDRAPGPADHAFEYSRCTRVGNVPRPAARRSVGHQRRPFDGDPRGASAVSKRARPAPAGPPVVGPVARHVDQHRRSPENPFYLEAFGGEQQRARDRGAGAIIGRGVCPSIRRREGRGNPPRLSTGSRERGGGGWAWAARPLPRSCSANAADACPPEFAATTSSGDQAASAIAAGAGFQLVGRTMERDTSTSRTSSRVHLLPVPGSQAGAGEGAKAKRQDQGRARGKLHWGQGARPSVQSHSAVGKAQAKSPPDCC